MNSVAIFDSLTHPMPNADWLHVRYHGKNSIEALLTQMQSANICKAFAVGLGRDIGGYNESTYAQWVRSNSADLLPVAFCDMQTIMNIGVDVYIQQIKSFGYVGLKIHPRIAQITLGHPLLPQIIRCAHHHQLVVMICTYYWSAHSNAYESDASVIHQLMCAVSDCRVILLHGGVIKLLEVAEIVRHFPNVLLDLSFTMCKYAGSSLDFDIRYLFAQFDRRVCVGSDAPEFTPIDLRMRFDALCSGLDVARVTRIAAGNIQRFMEQL
jgi:predicted TIM-barrel fold metal-dependent hydrolase